MASWIIQFINTIINNFANVIKFIIGILPKSPFSWINNSAISQYLPTFNWFFPVSEIIATLEFWITAISLYYLYQIIMRWIKAIE